MINWIPLASIEQLQEFQPDSRSTTSIIFKHSTSCSISSVAKYRLDQYWDIDDPGINFYFLDIHRHRQLSDLIAETFGVRHESPQILMIRDGKCVYHGSHLDVSAGNIKAHMRISANF